MKGTVNTSLPGCAGSCMSAVICAVLLCKITDTTKSCSISERRILQALPDDGCRERFAISLCSITIKLPNTFPANFQHLHRIPLFKGRLHYHFDNSLLRQVKKSSAGAKSSDQLVPYCVLFACSYLTNFLLCIFLSWSV